MVSTFFLNPSIGKATAFLFVSYAIFIAIIATSHGRLLVSSNVIISFVLLAFFFWLTLTYGVFIKANGENVEVIRFFLRRKSTKIMDIASVKARSIFGGLVTEVYLNVRNSDGSIREQSLINKPGLSDEEYIRLFDTLLSINPKIEIDPDLLPPTRH